MECISDPALVDSSVVLDLKLIRVVRAGADNVKAYPNIYFVSFESSQTLLDPAPNKQNKSKPNWE